MTGLPPETPAEAPEENLAEETPPSERPDPEEYTPEEAVSDETGTVYDGLGETESTPQDLVVDEEDEVE